MAGPTLLTVIVNWRTPDLTLAAAAAALREMDGIDGGVVVVDNASDDGSFEYLSRAAASRGWTEGRRVRVLQSGHNGGFGAGNNFGMRAGLPDGGRPDHVYILNSDAQPGPGAIRVLLDHMIAHPRTGIAGSYIHAPPSDGDPGSGSESGGAGEWHCTCFRFPSIASEFESAARIGLISRALARHVVPLPRPDAPLAVDWLAGASAMLRCDMLDQIGAFDEGFFLYFEETDLCRRARAAGWENVYLPGSRVAHVGSASTGMKTWARIPRYWLDSRRRYFTKIHGRRYAAAATMARIAGTLLWRLRRLVTGQRRLDPPHFLRDLAGHALRPSAGTGKAGPPRQLEGNRT